MQYNYFLNEVNGRKNLTIFIGGVPTPIDQSHPVFDEILDAVKQGEPLRIIRDLIDMEKRIKKQLHNFGNVKVEDGVVYYKGEAVHGLLADRMIKMLEEGFDIRPWALFVENLQQNPAKHAVDELYLWLEKANMPITERGNFLAYKKVQDDYTSYHNNPDGSPFRNDIGTFVNMPRNKVDDNRHRTCSQGLHFCSWDYLPHYMGNRGRVVLVEVNPAHVVSIPSDYNNAKGRAEGYLIVGEIPEDQCQHAFDNVSIVHDNSEWYSFKPAPADYDDIDDGWFIDDYQRYDEEDEADAYDNGYAKGFNDSSCDLDYYDEAPECYEFYMDSYMDGYADGWNAAMTDCITYDAPADAPWDVHYWTEKGIADAITRGDLTLVSFIQNYDPDIYNIKEVTTRLKMDY